MKKITTRLDKYCKLLENIYGEKIVKAFTTKNENTLTMNDVANNQKAKKEYDRKDGEGCKRCQADFRNKENFFKRNLEFPGWIDKLEFSENSPAKDIMIIGEAPTTLKEQVDQINIAFGLGLYPIKNNGKLDFEQLKKTYVGEKTRLDSIIRKQTKKNRFWEYLNGLFSKKLDIVKPMIYITDLCKCNDDIKSKNKKEQKNQLIWKKCLNSYLIREIELINPKLVIFQGWDSYKCYMSYLEENKIITKRKDILEDIKEYYPQAGYSETSLYLNPQYGKFPLNGKQIHFFVIFHQTNFFGKYKENYDITDYTNRHSEFIEKKIIDKVLKINEKKN